MIYGLEVVQIIYASKITPPKSKIFVLDGTKHTVKINVNYDKGANEC